MKAKQSPILKQYYEIKSKHKDAVLLFRAGDFYETYCKDAKVCSETLGITLTWRNTNEKRDYNTYEGAMSGFPSHALDTYLPKLIRAGLRVAICDPLDVPKTHKISEIVSPAKRDANGTTRHIMSPLELNALYWLFDEFIADSTSAEFEVHKNAFSEIKAFIHQRILRNEKV